MTVAVSKFLKSKEFFPITFHFKELDGELISIEKRPRFMNFDIIDFYSNNSHIGMIIQIQKTSNKIMMGPVTINKPYEFRNILNFTFIKLLEYYGLDDIQRIEIIDVSSLEFKNFLINLEFKKDGDLYYYDILPDRKDEFIKKLESLDIKILNRKEQIKNLVKYINEGLSEDEINELYKKILEKIEKREEVSEKYWENRLVAQLNLMLSTAKLFKNKVHKEEVLDLCIKTMIGYFDLDLKTILFKEFINLLNNKGVHQISNIQKIIEQMKELFSEEIKKIDVEKYINWINENTPIWRKNLEIKEQYRTQKILSSKLTISDFGKNIQGEAKNLIESFVKHFNV